MRYPQTEGTAEHPPSHPSLRRVLVVDDERDHADSLAFLLRQAGHAARAVYSGLEALQIVEQFQPDTVILDLAMPGLDGVTLAERLRAGKPEDALYLIAVTGSQSHGDHCLARMAGVNAYFTKPSDPDEILRLLEALGTP